MEVRKASIDDAPSIARVHIDSWRTTYQGIVSDEHLSKLSYQQLGEKWTKILGEIQAPEIVLVADHPQGGIIGFARAGSFENEEYPYDAELQAIYFLQHYQRKGFGKTLFFQVAEELHASDFQSLILWVLAENSSRYFYEDLGGILVAESQRDIGGQSLATVAYAWDSLIDLIRLS
jgi:ribosomal protein S18 acetylase RimI-like enzyme